jgi:poly(A) polymerase
MSEPVLSRLRFSNEDTDQILSLVENHMRFGDVERMKPSTFKRFIRLPRFDEHMQLHRLDCQASHRSLRLYDFTREKRAELPASAIRPEPLITGDDLIAAGYAPGPVFKQILSAVEDAQLDGGLQSKKQAMKFIRDKFPLNAVAS